MSFALSIDFRSFKILFVAISILFNYLIYLIVLCLLYWKYFAFSVFYLSWFWFCLTAISSTTHLKTLFYRLTQYRKIFPIWPTFAPRKTNKYLAWTHLNYGQIFNPTHHERPLPSYDRNGTCTYMLHTGERIMSNTATQPAAVGWMAFGVRR